MLGPGLGRAKPWGGVRQRMQASLSFGVLPCLGCGIRDSFYSLFSFRLQSIVLANLWSNAKTCVNCLGNMYGVASLECSRDGVPIGTSPTRTNSFSLGVGGAWPFPWPCSNDLSQGEKL